MDSISSSLASSAWLNSTNSVGFGTAALGQNCASVVTMALEEGFRFFDTAEADWWYDQGAVGRSLEAFFRSKMDEDCLDNSGQLCGMTCESQNLRISTKIPPWSLTSEEDIRRNAKNSRNELLGFCEDMVVSIGEDEVADTRSFPLDVYYIHAPTCWKGWHGRCDNHPPLLALRDSWRAMEAVVGLDHSAMRIGLSNIRPDELEDIVAYVRTREKEGVPEGAAPPRIPDAVQAFADPIQPAEELRRVCQKYGIEFVSYSTLGTQHQRSEGNPVLENHIVLDIANKHGRSVAEVVLSWALHHGMSIIPRSSRREHIRELARLLDQRPFLDASDLERIDSMKNTV